MVFESSCGSQYISTVKRICKEAGITGNKTDHSLRATMATRGLKLGIPDKILMERTGHRSVAPLSAPI